MELEEKLSSLLEMFDEQIHWSELNQEMLGSIQEIDKKHFRHKLERTFLYIIFIDLFFKDY